MSNLNSLKDQQHVVIKAILAAVAWLSGTLEAAFADSFPYSSKVPNGNRRDIEVKMLICKKLLSSGWIGCCTEALVHGIIDLNMEWPILSNFHSSSKDEKGKFIPKNISLKNTYIEQEKRYFHEKQMSNCNENQKRETIMQKLKEELKNEKADGVSSILAMICRACYLDW